jgi:hypothetical protein
MSAFGGNSAAADVHNLWIMGTAEAKSAEHSKGAVKKPDKAKFNLQIICDHF